MPGILQKAPRVVIVKAGAQLTAAVAASLNQCKLRFHLKAGMTNQEANDAIDAGYQKFFSCLKSKAQNTAAWTDNSG